MRSVLRTGRQGTNEGHDAQEGNHRGAPGSGSSEHTRSPNSIESPKPASTADPGIERGDPFDLGFRWNKPYPYLRLLPARWHR